MTGTIHVLSISGLQVGFLAVAVFQVLRMLAVSRGWSLLVMALATGRSMVPVSRKSWESSRGNASRLPRSRAAASPARSGATYLRSTATPRSRT
ncbi:MAG: ComEC/Rec2 family competence protein [Planctomycetia bacterium]